MAMVSLCELCTWQMDDALLLWLLCGKLHQMAYSVGHQCLNRVREMPQFSKINGRQLWR